MESKRQKVLVTGACGFIGSHLTEALVREGYKVRALVLYNSFNSNGWLEALPTEIQDKIDVVAGDVRDYHFVERVLRGHHAVLHLAALISIPYSYVAPDQYIETNIKGTLNIVQAATKLGLSRVIYTSTSEVYGSAKFVPISEDHPLHPQSPYSASKISAEQVAMSFYNTYNTPLVIIRPFNTYGPRQSARAVIPTIITQLAAGYKEISLGALHPTRDFNFVSDTVAGFVAAMNADIKAIAGSTINIGSGFEISIGDLAKTIAEVMKKDIVLKADEQRVRPINSEVLRLVADNRKAKKLLDWKPKYYGIDGLKAGIQQTIDWLSVPENQRKYRAWDYNI